MSKFFMINGEILPEAEAFLKPTDIGFRRGYAAFDFLRIYQGSPLFIDDHLARFYRSAERLGLEMPLNITDYKERLLELIKRTQLHESGLQMFLTGGDSPDGFNPATPNLIVILVPLPQNKPEAFSEGVKLISHNYQRDLPEAKSNNYFMAVNLSKRIRDEGAKDVLYYHDDKVLETTRSNIFMVTEGGTLVTAKEGVLHGVTRKHLLNVARDYLKVEERDINLEEFGRAKEVFLSGTTLGAMPVRQIDERIIGDGKPGPVTLELTIRFKKHVEAYLAQHSLFNPA
ncbi:MAG: aminotransferase class IV [Deinococcales bacterium]